jgi:hypothetical protein
MWRKAWSTLPRTKKFHQDHTDFGIAGIGGVDLYAPHGERCLLCFRVIREGVRQQVWEDGLYGNR